MFDDCVIMAGGPGTRLWPASNSKNPKQFLSAPFPGAAGGASSSGERNTFLAGAVERAIAVTGKGGGIVIIAGKNHILR
ncbi:MAG: hypothetical protein LBD71_03785, partial [Treponema sp.]|nr:hypothetical protein [Treponema sp.]